jgi:hypothetical protein
MTAKVGDRIKVESEKAGVAAREGEILEVIEASYGTRYRVRWDDGHESIVQPHGGTVSVSHPEQPGVSR